MKIGVNIEITELEQFKFKNLDKYSEDQLEKFLKLLEKKFKKLEPKIINMLKEATQKEWENFIEKMNKKGKEK